MKRVKEWLKKFFHRRRLIRYGIYFTLLLVLFLCRRPILRGLGYWLIEEDEIEQADAMVMLGGNPLERAPKVKQLFQKNYAPEIICTGSQFVTALQSVGINMTEAENGKKYLVKMGIPDSCINAFNEGTSTLEEAEALKVYCKKRKFKKLIVVSSMFHTARVHKYFNRVFDESGIKLIVQGANPMKYKIDKWWTSEEGLLFVNNEYVKSFYYWWKY